MHDQLKESFPRFQNFLNFHLSVLQEIHLCGLGRSHSQPLIY
jgi:hypothetical protein